MGDRGAYMGDRGVYMGERSAFVVGDVATGDGLEIGTFLETFGSSVSLTGWGPPGSGSNSVRFCNPWTEVGMGCVQTHDYVGRHSRQAFATLNKHDVHYMCMVQQ
jgi:hypothetical protein